MGIERSMRRMGGLITAGSFFLSISILAPFGWAWAEDGAREALELRYHAELAIAKERASGRLEMAEAMQEGLSGLLQEYLVTRDGTVALDTVDDIFVQEQFKTARAAEEPGVALALDVFSGPGTGHENALRTSLSGLAEFHNERDPLQVTKGTVDAYERQMERQLDKIERTIGKDDGISERLETKLEARLDAGAERLERKEVKAAPRAESIAEKAEEKVAEKAERKEEGIEQKLEKQEEKQEKQQENQEEKEEKSGKRK